MARILGIETTTNICSVAVLNEGKTEKIESEVPNSHSEVLGTFIKKILSNIKIKVEQLDAIAVSKGPGSYTGLRIGVSTAKGLCYGAGIPLIGINTLEGMAESFINKYNNNDILLCPTIDARRDEIFYALYDNEMKCLKKTSSKVLEKNSFEKEFQNKKIVFFGTGAEKCKNIIQNKNDIFANDFKMSAGHILALAEKRLKKKEFEDLAYFEPFYLKDFVAIPQKKNILK